MSYDFDAFYRGIAELDGHVCWLWQHLHRIERERPGTYSPGLLKCHGLNDPHHLLRKNRLKQELPHGHGDVSLSTILEDPRNGILVCRRHHDLLERALVVLTADEVPGRFWEFCRDYGLEGWGTRYFSPHRKAA